MILTANGASHSVQSAAESSPDPVPLDQDVDGNSRTHGCHPGTRQSGYGAPLNLGSICIGAFYLIPKYLYFVAHASRKFSGHIILKVG